MLVSHILPNLSAWTFPSVTSNPPTQESTALPPNQPIQVTTTSTILGSTPVPSVPAIPVTCRGTVYYVPPPVITTPAVVGTSTQASSWLSTANAASVFPPQANTVPPTSSACFTLPEVAYKERSPTRVETVPIQRGSRSMARVVRTVQERH